MNEIIGRTSDGRDLRPRSHPTDEGDCADCGRHVDPKDPSLWSHLTDTGLEERTDEAGLRDEEMLAGDASSSMGSETLDDSPGGRFREQGFRDGVGKAPAEWDGACPYCGAPANRVGRAE